MTLSKLSEMCKACSSVDTCNHKRMELCALKELPLQISANASLSATAAIASPIMREPIKNPLSPFRYKDELEKALNDYHFGDRFMRYGG